MFVSEILLEKEDKTAQLGQRIINLLKKTPTVSSPLEQYTNDPNKVHRTARSNFRDWCKRQGMKYVVRNTLVRGGKGAKKIAFYSFIGLMQNECGMEPTGILDVKTMKSFLDNASRFSDSYITQRVESEINSSSYKVPRGCVDVVQRIENQGDGWSSTYATYHDINNVLDFGVGPGQVEPPTYGDIGGKFRFDNFNHMTSIYMLTNLMMETIQHKMKFADRRATKNNREFATLEDFAISWNPVHFGKAKSIYGDNIPMRDEVSVKKPLTRPDNLGQPVDKEPTKEPSDPQLKTIEPYHRTGVGTGLKKELEPKDKQGYMQKLKKGFGNILRGYLDSEG